MRTSLCVVALALGGLAVAGASWGRGGSALEAPVLMYHHVQTLEGEPGRDWLRYTVSPGVFREHLDWLAREGYGTVTAAELGEMVTGGRTIGAAAGKKPVVLTFDDGWACCYDTVFPELVKRGMRGTFFVYPSGIGHPGYMTWEQLREMRAGGMDIQSHTVTHPNLRTMRDEAALQELVVSKRTLESMLGVDSRVSVLAYPFGEYSGRTETLAEQAGYACAFSTDVGVLHTAGDLWRLKRVMVTYTDGIAEFERAVKGDDGGAGEDQRARKDAGAGGRAGVGSRG